MHLDVMDVRKWSWPGALTFGKGQGTQPPHVKEPGVNDGKTETGKEEIGKEEKVDPEQPGSDSRTGPVTVDTSSLQDAMESDTRSVSAASSGTHGSSDTGSKHVDGLPHTSDSDVSEQNIAETDQEEHPHVSVLEADPTPTASQLIIPSAPTDSPRSSLKALSIKEPDPPPELLSTTVHLPREAASAAETVSMEVFYFKVSFIPSNPV